MKCICPSCLVEVDKLVPVVVNTKHLRRGGVEQEAVSMCRECASSTEPYEFNEEE